MSPPGLGEVLLAVAARHLPEDDCAQAANRLGLPHRRAWCVVLVDGLGWHNLSERAAEYAPFLTGALAQQEAAGLIPPRLRAGLPTTTATNLAYLGTGQLAGRTSMLGYTVRNPATGGLLNLISWHGGADPVAWQPVPTVLSRLQDAGAVVHNVGTWRFEDSGLTRAALRGGQYHPAESLRERIDITLHLLRTPSTDLVYLYWGALDTIAHQQGWSGRPWAEALADLDREMRRMAHLMPPDAGLLVTADHGVLDVPLTPLVGTRGRIDAATHPELSRDVVLIGGEPRFCHVHTDQPNAVAHRWRDTLGEAAHVLTKSEAIEANWFGPVTRHAGAIIGDVVAAAQGTAAILDSSQQSAGTQTMVGMHGSTTPIERDIPLVALTH